MKRFIFSLLALFTATLANAQPSNPGIQRFGTVTPGNCVAWLNNFQVEDAGFACSGLAPGGLNGELQYNNGGVFGGISGWTTNGSTTLTGSSTALLSWNGDLFLQRDAANILAQRNGTNAQTLRVYETFTDLSNFSRVNITYDGATFGGFIFQAENAGTGTYRNVGVSGAAISFQTGSSFAGKSIRWRIDSSGHFLPQTNAAYDIGSASNGVRKLFLAGGTLGDQAQVLAITATQPASPTGTQSAITATITSAGSASQDNIAFNLSYASGYTGSSRAFGALISNTVASTGSTLIPAAGSNSVAGSQGLTATAGAAGSGNRVGLIGVGSAGANNVGVIGLSQTATNSATNIGVVGSAINTGTSPVQIGGFFSLNQTSVPSVSAALIADNGGQTSDIFVARDNGSTVFTIADGAAATTVTVTGVTSTNFTTGNANQFRIGNRTRFSSATDGNILFSNAGGTDFGLMQYGGVTSSFAAVKRFGNALAIRQADDTVGAFANLTACASGGEGALAVVTDSSTATWGATVTGGGANRVLAYCNGTNWTVAAI